MKISYDDRMKFNRLTGLHIEDYWSPLFGFDNVKLAELFPDFYESEKSLREYIVEKWGEETAQLIESLL